MLDSIDLSMYVYCGIMTIIMSSLVAITFLRSKELRQHPSGLIMGISICEVIISYHSIVFAFGSKRFVDSANLEHFLIILGIGSADSLSILCGTNQIILSGATVACFCYNIAICLDLVITLRSPLVPGRVRKKWYHGITAVTVVYFTIYLNIQNKFFTDCESNEENHLEIMNTGSVIILLIVYMFTALVSIIYAVYRYMNGLKIDSKKTKEYLVRHALYVCIFTLCWACPVISYLMATRVGKLSSANMIERIAICSTSISGFLQGFVRLSDPAVRKRIRWSNVSKDNETSQGEAWNQPVSAVVLSNLNAELSQCIFRGLHSSYSQSRSANFYLGNKKKTSKKSSYLMTEGISQMEAWGVNDSNLKGVNIDFFYPGIFLEIINKSRVTLDEILESLSPGNNENNFFDQSTGKSGSFMLFTKDKRLSIKTIKSSERRTMLKFLKNYYSYIIKHPNSLLCRIYGVFSISVPGVTVIDVILMQNVFFGVRCEQVFDIKGSTVGRSSKGLTGRVTSTLKDLDFKEMNEKLRAREEDIDMIRIQIYEDVELLKENNLMDYSMLIAKSKFDEKVEYMHNSFKSEQKNQMFTLGIIDFLTEYGWIKTLERKFAAFRHGKNVRHVSVAAPAFYSNRFYNFIFRECFQNIRGSLPLKK